MSDTTYTLSNTERDLILAVLGHAADQHHDATSMGDQDYLGDYFDSTEGEVDALISKLAGDEPRTDYEVEAKADAEAFHYAPAKPLDQSQLIAALAVLVFDPRIRRSLDPKALSQARTALGLEAS